jgi:hypothetical protein
MMVGFYVAADNPDGCGNDRCVIGKAKTGDNIGNEVDGHRLSNIIPKVVGIT